MWPEPPRLFVRVNWPVTLLDPSGLRIRLPEPFADQVLPEELAPDPVPVQTRPVEVLRLVRERFLFHHLPLLSLELALQLRVREPSALRMSSPIRFVVHVRPCELEPLVTLDQDRPVSVLLPEPVVFEDHVVPRWLRAKVLRVHSHPSEVRRPEPSLLRLLVRPRPLVLVHSLVQERQPSFSFFTVRWLLMVAVLLLSHVTVLVSVRVRDPSSLSVQLMILSMDALRV